MIVTGNTTIMDGTVVRWYRTLEAAQIHRPVLSASRHGVVVHASFLNEIPSDWIAAAMESYETLRADRTADVSHLATHRNEGPSNGPLKPVQEATGE